MLGQQLRPDYDVPVFNIGKPRVDVFLFRIELRRRENAIEVRGISFVLPVVLERVNVDFRFLGRRRGWPRFDRRRHASISPASEPFAPAATIA